jgi:hypothetical protein
MLQSPLAEFLSPAHCLGVNIINSKKTPTPPPLHFLSFLPPVPIKQRDKQGAMHSWKMKGKKAAKYMMYIDIDICVVVW